MSALHVFDMDGTLLRGTTASIELSRRLDRLGPLAGRGAPRGESLPRSARPDDEPGPECSLRRD